MRRWHQRSIPLVTGASVAPHSTAPFDVTWTLAAPVTATDGTIAVLQLASAVPPTPGGTWAFVVPQTVGSMRTPVLPCVPANEHRIVVGSHPR